jgi:tripartite-type tricarboxylate transporter receptor subunit TctC
MNDVIAGQIDLMVDASPGVLPYLPAGAIKAYAVMSKNRLATAPDIPTVDEAGLPGIHVFVWYGLWAPRGTPNSLIGKLNSAATDAMADPLVRARLADLGLQVPPTEEQTPAALGALQKVEIEKWWPIIKAANIKGE